MHQASVCPPCWPSLRAVDNVTVVLPVATMHWRERQLSELYISKYLQPGLWPTSQIQRAQPCSQVGSHRDCWLFTGGLDLLWAAVGPS